MNYRNTLVLLALSTAFACILVLGASFMISSIAVGSLSPHVSTDIDQYIRNLL